MVSTHSQYITDYSTSNLDTGKSPLAMLAKTCETIGLPDTPNKKEKKDDSKKSTDTSPSTISNKKDRCSPKSGKSLSEPVATTFPGLPKPPQMPAGFPAAAAFPYFNPLMGYPMPPFATFPSPFMPRMPCQAALMQGRCVTPGCMSCSPMPPEMMASFAAHPLFSAYSGMMPSVSNAAALSSYQALLAQSMLPSTSSATSTLPMSLPSVFPTSLPSTSTPSTTAKSSTPKVSPIAKKENICNWMVAGGICGKKFDSDVELNNHLKTVHTPSPPSSATSETPERAVKTPIGPIRATPSTSTAMSAASTPSGASLAAAAYRFHPYGKPVVSTPLSSANSNALLPPTLPNPAMFQFPNALQAAMYTQRLMSTMPMP